MDASGRLKADVERWLVQRSYRPREAGGELFKFVVDDTGRFGNRLVAFGPRGQPGVLVVGALCPLGMRQNARYARFTGAEAAAFASRLRQFCGTVRAVHRVHEEPDGRVIVGVYIVLDGKGGMRHDAVTDAAERAVRMGEETSEWLAKAI